MNERNINNINKIIDLKKKFEESNICNKEY